MSSILDAVDEMISQYSPAAEEPEEECADMVNHPPHYRAGGIECIDAIQAALTPEEFAGHCKSCVLKYVWRERHKGGLESLKKGQWYLQKLIDNYPGGAE